ncbi:hypothetical protein BJ912DRAFT_192512 [Pholiota molesta]|nr:hypothetical protein BJ912DRAFT_192512 [Pholiota molesta]
MRVGFFYVKTHGIPDSTSNGLFKWQNKFSPFQPTFRWSLVENKRRFPRRIPDCPTGNNDMNTGVNGVMAGANVWPQEADVPSSVKLSFSISACLPPSKASSKFILLSTSYAAVNLGRALSPIFALALNLPEDLNRAADGELCIS